MRAFSCMIVLAASLVLISSANARQLFWDDFEADLLGTEPAQWERLDVGGEGGGEVIADPDDRDNKVFSMPDRFVATKRDHGEFYVIGSESWVDYIAEWDWMPSAEECHGMNFRFQNDEEYYKLRS